MIDYQSIRRQTRPVKVGNVTIGGSAPISIQSMTNTDTKDVAATVDQVRRLEQAGCEIVRITVPDAESAQTITAIKQAGIRVPIVADIHFDYRAAVACAERGVDKIRINPGNIGDESRVKAVVDACKRGNTVHLHPKRFANRQCITFLCWKSTALRISSSQSRVHPLSR